MSQTCVLPDPLSTATFPKLGAPLCGISPSCIVWGIPLPAICKHGRAIGEATPDERPYQNTTLRFTLYTRGVRMATWCVCGTVHNTQESLGEGAMAKMGDAVNMAPYRFTRIRVKSSPKQRVMFAPSRAGFSWGTRGLWLGRQGGTIRNNNEHILFSREDRVRVRAQ